MTRHSEAYQQDRDTRAAYLRDMRQQYIARRDVFRNIVHWQHKANGYKVPAPLAWNYWQATRTAPPPF